MNLKNGKLIYSGRTKHTNGLGIIILDNLTDQLAELTDTRQNSISEN